MKGYWVAALLLWFALVPPIPGAEERILLRLPNPNLKAGQVVNVLSRLYQATQRTNQFGEEITTTNNAMFFEVKGRMKVVDWNVEERSSKLDVLVEQMLHGDAKGTNTVLHPGAHLLCTYFAGESFFRPSEGYLSLEASQILRTLLQFTPGGKEDAADAQLMKLDQPRAVGETWPGASDKVHAMIAQLYGVVETNRVESSVTFAALTNISGVQCFQLNFSGSVATDVPPRIPAVARGLIEKSFAQIEIRGTNVCPVQETLPRSWSSLYSIDGATDIKGGGRKGVVRVRFVQTQEVQLSVVPDSPDK